MFIIGMMSLLLVSCDSHYRQQIFTDELASISWGDSLLKISKEVGAKPNDLYLQQLLISWNGRRTDDINLFLFDSSDHQGYTISYQAEASKYTSIQNNGVINGFENTDLVLCQDVFDILDKHKISSFQRYSHSERDFMMLGITNGNISYGRQLTGRLFKVSKDSLVPFNENETLNLPHRTISLSVGLNLFILNDLSS